MAKSKSDPADSPRVVRTRDADRTRAALLKAGLKEFARYGPAGARLERVVKTAGCNIRMVYHYYGGKDGLYAAVVAAARDQMRREEARQVIDLDMPLAGILDLMRFSFEFFQRNPRIEALLGDEAGVSVARLRLVEDLVASGHAKGLFRDDLDAEQICLTIAALSRFHDRAEAGTSREERGARRLQHCLDLLEAGVLGPRVKKRLVTYPRPGLPPSQPVPGHAQGWTTH